MTVDESPNIALGFYQESEFTKPSPNCPHPELWHTYDIQGTEVEVITMVWGLIRGTQPDRVLETGTSRGFMASAIGQALRDNGHGHLHTYEPVPRTAAEAHVHTAGVRDWLTIHTQPSMVPWEYGPIDFAWFDSLLDLRYQEFDFYYEHMHSRTIVGFHDTARHFGNWSDQIRNDKRLATFDMPTPRGMILGRVR